MASKFDNSTLENFLKFNDRETPEKMKEVARRELGETEELKEKCLKEMKTLIKEHELSCITRDDFLLRFLRTKKFDVRQSFESLRNYSKHRVEFHKQLMEFRPEILEKCLRLNILGCFPYRDQEESMVFFGITGAWNPSICSDDELLVIAGLLANYACEYEFSQLTGGVAVVDNTIIPLKYMGYALRHVNLLRTCALKGLPMRYRMAHSINEGSIIHYVLKIGYPFVPKKLRSRLILHGKTREKLFQHLPRCIVPNEFGGTLGPLNNDHLIAPMLDYLQKMKDEQRYFLQEKVR